jgi:hypothetical protein
MASSCTFADVPFLLPIAEAEDYFALRLPLGDFRLNQPERVWPGPNQIGLTYPVSGYPKRPDLRLNQFYYPTHIQRWGEWNGLVDLAGYNAIQSTCFIEAGPQTATFEMSQDGIGSISTPMFCLSLKPIATGSTTNQMFLCTLVDGRYFLQYTNAAIPSTGGGWDSMLASVASGLSITLTYDTCATAYALPHPMSDIVAQYANAAVLLDAIAANTGRVIVRNWDGSYYCQNISTANDVDNDPDLLAGGDLTDSFGTVGTNYAVNALLPNQVQVTFPLYLVPSLEYLNAETTHVPFPRTQGAVWVVTVPISTAFPGWSGFNGTKTFRTTAEAYICSAGDASPLNASAINELAVQIATDYYTWQYEGLEESTPGIFKWNLEGINDLLFSWNKNKTWTRIQRKPYNFGVEEFNHHFTLATCSTSSSSSSESNTGSNSGTSGSTGSNSGSNCVQIITGMTYNSTNCTVCVSTDTFCFPSCVSVLYNC